MLNPRSSLSLRHHGFTIMEALVAMAVTLVVAASLITALLSTQRYAAASRVMTNARVIVQRNIDTALGVKFTSAQEPAVLAITDQWHATTKPTGERFGDYNILTDTAGDANQPIPIHIDKDGTVIVEGTLTRIVRPYPSAVSKLVVREVTFRIDYRFDNRDFTYSMTTLRAQDDQ